MPGAARKSDHRNPTPTGIGAGHVSGTHVAVFRLIPAPIMEGWATIDRPSSDEHRFLVRFAGDPVARERFIHPDWQADPVRVLTLLRQLWRAEMVPDIADFFPEEST